jgi:DNA-binding NtrC family response regulator
MNDKQWVLVLDDETYQKNEARRMLEKSGFGVYMAASSDDAAACYTVARECGYPFAAVIMNVSAADRSGGGETIKRLFDVDPDVRVIAIGGEGQGTDAENLRAHGFREVLARPFTGEDLDRVLRMALNNGRQAA